MCSTASTITSLVCANVGDHHSYSMQEVQLTDVCSVYVQEIGLLKSLSFDANIVQFYGACLQEENTMMVLEFMAVRLLFDVVMCDFYLQFGHRYCFVRRIASCATVSACLLQRVNNTTGLLCLYETKICISNLAKSSGKLCILDLCVSTKL